MTITSPDNEKLKLVRKLRDRKHRDRHGLFVTEGEDLLDAGRRRGVEPQFVLAAGGLGLGGEEVAPELLDAVSELGSGTRVIAVWPQPAGHAAGPVCLYLHGVGDPGNVGTIIRTADALVGGAVVLGPGCADPFGPKAVRATMGSIFNVTLRRGAVADTPEPRVALVAHGGEPLTALGGPPVTLCLGAEREGLPSEVVDACEMQVTIPVRPGAAESLNVAAAAAIGCERISSRAGADESPENPA